MSGLSIDRFAARLGVAPETVAGWERIRGPLRLEAQHRDALAALAAEIRKGLAG